MSRADLALGRTASITVHIQLIPPPVDDIGEPDAVMDYAVMLVSKAAKVLKDEGESDGFTVKITPGVLVAY